MTNSGQPSSFGWTMPRLNFNPIQNNNFAGTVSQTNVAGSSPAPSPSQSGAGAPVFNFNPIQNNNFPAPSRGTSSAQGSAQQPTQQPTQQPQQQPLNSAQQTAQNMYLNALQRGDSATIAQIQRNFGLSTQPLSSQQMSTLSRAASQGQYILDPQLYGRILTGAATPPAQQQQYPASQQVSGNIVNGIDWSDPANYGSSNNGFGQYSPNLNPNLTLNPRLQAELHAVMDNASTYQALKNLPPGSPLKAALEEKKAAGSGLNASGYNGAGQPYDTLQYGNAYDYVAATAQLTGRVIPPDLAAALHGMDNYANSHNSLNYGANSSGGGSTNFGAGDGGAYEYVPVVIPGYTNQNNPGIIPAITPTQQSMGRGGLFGDDIRGGAQSYIGSPTTPNIVNTGTPYLPGAVVHPAAAQIVPPSYPSQTYVPPAPIPSTDWQPGTPWTPDFELPGMGQGNPAGNTPVWIPGIGYVTQLPSAPAQGSIVGQPQGANLTTQNVSSPTNDVFGNSTGYGTPTTAISNPSTDVFAQNPTAQQHGSIGSSAGLNFADGVLQGVFDEVAKGGAGTKQGSVNLLKLLNGLHP